MVDTAGFHTAYAYTRRGELASVTDPLDRTTRYEYDPRGLLAKLILPDPDGAGSLTEPITQYFYDAGSNLTKTIDAEGNETEYQYDDRHRMTELWESAPTGTNEGKASTGDPPIPAGPVTKYWYNDAGQLARVTNAESQHVVYAYDDAARLHRVAESSTADTTTIVDDGDATGFSITGDWDPQSDVDAFGGGYQEAPNGIGNVTATWTFGVEAGKTYEVFATWVVVTGNATNAPYTVYDGTTAGTELAEVPVDQTRPPAARPISTSVTPGKASATSPSPTTR